MRRTSGILIALAMLCVATGLPSASAQGPAVGRAAFTVAAPDSSPAVTPLPSAEPCPSVTPGVAPESPLPDATALPEGSTPSAEPCPPPSPEPCPTVAPAGSPNPGLLATPEPSAVPSVDPAASPDLASPRPQPTPCASLEPSASPSAVPEVTPSPSPSPSPTHKPRPSRTPRPTPSPTPHPTRPPGPPATPAPITGSVPQFLTLPLSSLTGMTIQQGWLWVGCCHPPLHGGVDYIKGTRDVSSTWQSFPIVAAASGKVCAAGDGQSACGITGTGIHVIIRTRVAGQTWYTYYGHLRTLDPSIPIGTWSSTPIARGTFLGEAGHSGDPCCVVHLHFEVLDSRFVIRDPYDLYTTRSAYPDPQGTNGRRAGPDSLFISDPPRRAAAAANLPVAALIGTDPNASPRRARRRARRAR
jgi:murein DD-endopeptidase MepM/ murein hydrolase activator NlpD